MDDHVFPLNAVLMELAAILQQRSLRLDLHWAPRLQNALADALTNQQYDSFSAELRLRFDFSRYQSIILKDLMRAGESLYGDIKEYKESCVGRGLRSSRKGRDCVIRIRGLSLASVSVAWGSVVAVRIGCAFDEVECPMGHRTHSS